MECSDKFFKMDTIAKAENVAMLWDYLLFSNMNKRFQLYVFGKAQYEVLNTFQSYFM
jgi:hypothetical protein